MLPKENKITEKREFDEVLKKGHAVQQESLGLFFAKEGSSNPPRFGIIISNKISKLANRRNRARRVIKEVIRGLLGNIKSGFLFVILTKKNIIGRTRKELEMELRSALKRTGALK